MYCLITTQWVELYHRKQLYLIETLSWICVDLQAIKNLQIRRKVREKNTWFELGAELKKQLSQYSICFVWNTTLVIHKVSIVWKPTISVANYHFCRGALSLALKSSIIGVMGLFQQDSLKKTNGTSFSGCIYLRGDCVLL